MIVKRKEKPNPSISLYNVSILQGFGVLSTSRVIEIYKKFRNKHKKEDFVVSFEFTLGNTYV